MRNFNIKNNKSLVMKAYLQRHVRFQVLTEASMMFRDHP
jgi:hypothetical protein